MFRTQQTTSKLLRTRAYKIQYSNVLFFSLALSAAGNFCAFVDQHGFGAVVIPLTAVGKGRPQPMPAVRVGAEASAWTNANLSYELSYTSIKIGWVLQVSLGSRAIIVDIL